MTTLSPKQQQIADDHVAVAAGMQRIGAELARLDGALPSTSEWEELGAELGAFRDLLRDHFAREERDTFFGRGIPWDPATRDVIDQLLAQHRRFLSTMEQLLDEFEGGSASMGALGKELDNLFTNLRWHDTVETGLLRRIPALSSGAEFGSY